METGRYCHICYLWQTPQFLWGFAVTCNKVRDIRVVSSLALSLCLFLEVLVSCIVLVWTSLLCHEAWFLAWFLANGTWKMKVNVGEIQQLHSFDTLALSPSLPVALWTFSTQSAPLNRVMPSSKIFLLTVPTRYFFFRIVCVIYILCLSCFHVCSLLNCGHLRGKGSWLLFVVFIMILLLSHLTSWDGCGAWLYRFLILTVFLTFT